MAVAAGTAVGGTVAARPMPSRRARRRCAAAAAPSPIPLGTAWPHLPVVHVSLPAVGVQRHRRHGRLYQRLRRREVAETPVGNALRRRQLVGVRPQTDRGAKPPAVSPAATAIVAAAADAAAAAVVAATGATAPAMAVATAAAAIATRTAATAAIPRGAATTATIPTGTAAAAAAAA